MKRDRTLDDDRPQTQRRVEKISVELQIDVRIQVGKQSLQRVAPQDFVRRADVSESSMTEVFDLQQLSDKEIAVIHERVELRVVRAQLFDDARAVYDFRMRQIREKLVDIPRTKGAIAFAENNDSSVGAVQRFLVATIDA